jgi:nucleotide-binding universal stress UspA family protein
MFKRILCAVDFSADSLEAFRAAADMARLHAASLHLLHVIEAQPVMPAGVEIRIIDEANAALEKLLASAGSSLDGLALTTEVTNGLASVEIVEHARQWKPDLVVLGSKGITSLEEIIVGSTAENVLKEAPCSVLIVRLDQKHDRAPGRD